MLSLPFTWSLGRKLNMTCTYMDTHVPTPWVRSSKEFCWSFLPSCTAAYLVCRQVHAMFIFLMSIKRGDHHGERLHYEITFYSPSHIHRYYVCMYVGFGIRHILHDGEENSSKNDHLCIRWWFWCTKTGSSRIPGFGWIVNICLPPSFFFTFPLRIP